MEAVEPFFKTAVTSANLKASVGVNNWAMVSVGFS
jgi:hypothetical protein